MPWLVLPQQFKEFCSGMYPSIPLSQHCLTDQELVLRRFYVAYLPVIPRIARIYMSFLDVKYHINKLPFYSPRVSTSEFFTADSVSYFR